MSLDRYQITGLLRNGRTGGVYEATDNTLNRKVAIRRFTNGESDYESDEYKEVFGEFTAQLAALQHPNLLTVFDAGFDQEGPYIVSASQDGYLLFEHLQNVGPLTEHDVYQMAQQILDSIISAHSLDINHGALSLRSILVKEKGYGGYLFKLIDLGLESLIKGTSKEASSTLADLTIMAPELFDDNSPTPQSDLYTIGQLCYVAMIGGHPNAGADKDAMKQYHQSGAIPNIANYVQLNQGFANWIHKMIAVVPAERYQSAEEALKDLAQIVVLPAHVMAQHAAQQAAQAQQAQQVAQPQIAAAHQQVAPQQQFAQPQNAHFQFK